MVAALLENLDGLAKSVEFDGPRDLRAGRVATQGEDRPVRGQLRLLHGAHRYGLCESRHVFLIKGSVLPVEAVSLPVRRSCDRGSTRLGVFARPAQDGRSEELVFLPGPVQLAKLIFVPLQRTSRCTYTNPTNMKYLSRSLSTAVVLSTLAFSSFAQDESPFKDGSVFRVTMVRTEANSQDDYFKQLDQIYYPTMVQAKEQGLIKSFRLLAGDAANKEDFDVILLVEMENMAALDETPEREAKWKAIREGMKTKMGGQEKVDGLRAAINTKRDFLGSKLMREQLHK